MKSLYRFCWLIALLVLGGCMAADNPVPLTTMEQLVGKWAQVDGNARLQFYADESVKLIMPDEHPPLKVLSTVEIIKDDQIGFGIGDRWMGPVHIEHDKNWETITLLFPPDDPEGKPRSIRFRRLEQNTDKR